MMFAQFKMISSLGSIAIKKATQISWVALILTFTIISNFYSLQRFKFISPMEGEGSTFATTLPLGAVI